MIIVTQLPFVGTLIISFMNWNAYYPDDIGFAGLDNYITVLTNPNTRSAILVTILLTAGVVLISLVLGTVIALLLDRTFLGRGVVRTMMITPFLIVPVAAALLWKHALYNPSYGLFNGLLTGIFGENAPQPDWISQWPLTSVIAGAGLAVDPVHDADHPGRSAGSAAGRHRGGPDRRLLRRGRSSAT